MRPNPPQGRKDIQHFPGFPAVGQGQDHIVLGDHAQVPVDAFRRVQVEGRGAGAGQGSRNLAADDAGFAHAGHNNPALAVKNHFQGSLKMFIHPGQQLQNGSGFDFQRFFGFLQHFTHSLRPIWSMVLAS